MKTMPALREKHLPPMRDIAISGAGQICREALPANETGDWFQPSDYLGPRGYRYFTTSTQYALAAVKVALEDAGSPGPHYADEAKGVIMGTNFSDCSVREGFDRLLLAPGGAKNLSPLEAPNSSVNIPASTISIKNGFKAFSITLTHPMVAGLDSLGYGIRSLMRGNSDLVVAGATEGDVPARLESLLHCPVGPGAAAAFVLETSEAVRKRNGRIKATIAGYVSRFFPSAGKDTWKDARKDGRASDLIGKAMEREFAGFAWTTGGSLTVAMLASACPWNRAVRDAVERFPEARRACTQAGSAPGDDGRYITVSPLLQIQPLLSRPGPAVVIGTSPYGHFTMLGIDVHAS